MGDALGILPFIGLGEGERAGGEEQGESEAAAHGGGPAKWEAHTSSIGPMAPQATQVALCGTRP
ncbi:hypothetical protein GCM10009552_11820 [Rothia nasimurium]